MLAIVLIAVLLSVAAFVQSNWYEYHVLASGETPQNLVNQNGWEPVPGMETRSGIALNYRRPRLLPHPNVESPPAPASPTATPVTAIHSKAAELAFQMRGIVKNSAPGSVDVGMRNLYYASARAAYSELAAEVGLDSSPSANAAQALLPSLKAALDTAKTTLNNDDLSRLAVQLDHVA